MILIYTHKSSRRLQYICKFIFNEQLGVTHSISIDQENFKQHDGEKINYSDIEMQDAFNIKPHTLLFEKVIKPQQPGCFETGNYKAIFKIVNSDISFDIFAATFYLISRYEEYLPHELDMYGRYQHENSLAFKEGFLNLPLVNIWLQHLAEILKNRHPNIKLETSNFKFLPTYDIDIAFSFKHKGLFRNLGGFIRSPSVERLAVLSNLKKDPFDSYDFMNQLHAGNKLAPIYFFLVATSGNMYDKNISPYSNAMWQLIKRHARKYNIGLHPSWRSHNNLTVLNKEKKVLETASGVSVKDSRQHYIKLSLPTTYENLIEAGMENDYSMGYGSINGFRASVAGSFYWYNLKTEEMSSLRIHPFCFMDANSFYEQNNDAGQAYDELLNYQEICRNVNGTLITIFHNNFLGTDKQFAGWREMYLKFISQVPK